MKKILVIGGAGYVGSELVDCMLNKYHVTVYDLFIYGETLPDNKNLKKIRGDIRNIENLKKIIKEFDYVIHLACISNDPSFDLDPELGKSINFDPFEDLVKICKNSGVKRFIYASSSSVYGIKSTKDVDENSSLEPLTDYSKFKAMCEDILIKYTDKNFVGTIIRPATVCGFSKRQRLDLVVNILTNLAYNSGEITIFGGDQLRPNINIKDMCQSYMQVLDADISLVKGEIFNVGFENYPVKYLANIIKDVVGKNVKLKTVQTNDNRSYHISSKKIEKNIGFKTQFTIKDAVIDLKKAFEKNFFTNPLENELYFNIKRMNSIKLK